MDKAINNLKLLNLIHIPKNGGTSFSFCPYIAKGDHSIGPKYFVNKNLDYFLILRNPVDRLVSAYHWMKKDGYHLDKVRGISVEEFVEILSSKNHRQKQDFEYILKQHGGNHNIDGVPVEYSWIYERQSRWFDKPNHVLIMDNLEEEWNTLANALCIKWKLPIKNSTKPYKHNFSENALSWIKDFYKEDFELYEKWKKLNIKDRINIDWTKHN